MKLLAGAFVLLLILGLLLATRQQSCCDVANNEPYRQPLVVVGLYGTPAPTLTANPNVLTMATPTPAWLTPTPDPRNTPSPVAALKVSDRGVVMGQSVATDHGRFNWPGSWMLFSMSLDNAYIQGYFSKLVVMLNSSNLTEVKNISN